MTGRGFYTLLFGALLLVTGLSVGSAGCFLVGAAALAAWTLALVSVLVARVTLHAEQSLSAHQVQRGEACVYRLALSLFSPLPIAPVRLSLLLPGGRTAEYALLARMMGKTTAEHRLSCVHVGVFSVGLTQAALSDCFGLFSLRACTKLPALSVTSLPRPRDAQSVPFSPGEGETTSAQRAIADLSTPTDIRAWQDGDELKRVHWKLSMRRQSLMVHTYETPQRPDAVLLLDCAAPDVPPEKRAAVIDALTECCAGQLKALLEENRPVSLPLAGEGLRELNAQHASALPGLLAALAEQPFSCRTDFARVLFESSRRMRRTGSTVILTADLTPAVADAALSLSRLGPHTRFVLISVREPDALTQRLLAQLQNNRIETDVVQL